jgi:hypothetical protein
MIRSATMSSNLERPPAKAVAKPKKTYKKPSFRFERVFETMALSCGKLSGGGPRCITMRKNS